MSTTTAPQTNFDVIANQEVFIEFLLNEARTHGYIEGMTDAVEQHQQAVSKAIHVRISPFMAAYKTLLADKLNIQSDVRAQIDTMKYTISIVAIMQESDYLANLDNIYLFERAVETLLFKSFPSISTYCIDISVLYHSMESPLDRNLVTNDYPYVIN